MNSLPHRLVGDTAAAHGATRFRVLLIDAQANAMTDRISESFAHEHDIDLTCCQDPADALELARHTQPTTILVCLGQPLHDSLELIASFRASPDTRAIPIVALASNANAATRRAVFSAGANECFAGLPDDTELLDRVRFCSDSYLAKQELESVNRELARTRRHLLQSEKLASLGLLAAGVAHEINNPIAFVSSNLNSLDSYYRDVVGALDRCVSANDGQAAGQGGDGPIAAMRQAINFGDLREDVGQILDECRDGLSRVRKIVDNLKSYSRANESEWQWADLNEELDRALSLGNNELKYKAEVARNYGDLPRVQCLATQINQVLLNLLVNAAQAIDDRGTITVTTSRAVSPQGLVPDSASGAAEWVCIQVSDDGIGIAKDELPRIFEPFFTTKAVGEGTGLGLAVSSGIIENHNGFMDVDSEPGKGTTFSVWLPVSQDADGPQETANLETEQP